MTWSLRQISAALSVTAAMMMIFAPTANAAGALAVGDCGAYGYSYGYGSSSEAGQEALQQCRDHGGQSCTVQEHIEGSCAAFATDQSQSCGAQGWGRAPSQSEAENIAMRYCQQYGGSDCIIRRWVCDGH